MTEDSAELALVLMVFAVLLLLGTQYMETKRQKLDMEMRLLLTLTAMTMVLVPVIDVAVPWFEFADFPFLDEMAVAGVVVGAAAIGLFWLAQSSLSRHRKSASPEQYGLIEHGVYRYIRHPIHTAMLLWALAQVLLLQNWLAGPAAGITFALIYLLRTPRDEQALLERFGHRYLDYMNRTGSLLPRWPRSSR